MSSYLSQDSASQPQITHHSYQKSLELENTSLEDLLKDKQQSLNLQLCMFKAQSNNTQKDLSLQTIERLLQKQSQLRFFFTERLLKRQVKIEQAREMNEIIFNYQKRISDLRATLINKQGEISAASFSFLRSTITRRSNLEAINSETLQKMTLTKYAKQRKKLLVEVQALEFTLGQINKIRQPKESRSQLKEKFQVLKRQAALKKASNFRELNVEKQNYPQLIFKRHSDVMTDKIFKFVQQQTIKYEEHTSLVEKLKLQLVQIEEAQLKNISKYKKSEQEWAKMILNSRQTCTQGQNKGYSQLSFIKELEEQISNTNSQFLNSEFLGKIDTNKIESQSQVLKSSKHITLDQLKDKRRKVLKQN